MPQRSVKSSPGQPESHIEGFVEIGFQYLTRGYTMEWKGHTKMRTAGETGAKICPGVKTRFLLLLLDSSYFDIHITGTHEFLNLS